MAARNNRSRIHGFDAIRLLSFFAIASFHISLIHYYTPEINLASQSLIVAAVDTVSRLLSFSGFTVIFLTSLLIAYSGSDLRKRIGLFTFLCAGWVLFSALIYAPGQFFDWDVYPLIFVGILSATLMEKAGWRPITGLALVGFCMLWIPFWNLIPASGLSPSLRHVLGVANCARGAVAEWPVLPWIGLIWFGYGSGLALKAKRAAQSDELTVSRKEALVWGAFMLLSIPQLGAFYDIHLGRFFSCEAYRQPPFVYWSHFLWPLLAIRLSVDPRVQNRLGRLRVFRWISGLAISRRFWLAYVVHYPLAHVISFSVRTSGVEETRFNAPVIATIAVGFVPLIEIVTRAIWRIFESSRRALMARSIPEAIATTPQPVANEKPHE